MARKTITRMEYVDDVDGSIFAEGEGSAIDLALSVNGETKRYTLDLGAKNATAFVKALAPWLEKAHELAPRAASQGVKTADPDVANARAFARANGVEVSDRGRLSETVKRAWEDAGRPKYNADGTPANA